MLLASLLIPGRGINARLDASCGYGYTNSSTAPTVTAVDPTFGGTAGGTSVTITGTGFCSNTIQVFFGATAAASWVLVDDTTVTAVSPAHSAGTIDVTVQTEAGTSATSPADHYRYLPAPAIYHQRNPTRLLDTRNNGGQLGPGGSVVLAIGGISVPADATAVVLNVTATDTTAASFFTVYPTGGAFPTVSNLNWVAGETVPNLVTVSLGSGGDVTIYNSAGRADAVVDLEGYFEPSTGGTAGEFVPLAPARITDTRTGSGQANAGSHLGAGTTLDVQVTGAGGVPPTGAATAVLNITVTNTTAPSFLTVFPKGSALPLASNLNWPAGKTVPNRVVVPIGTGGKVSIYNSAGSADVIVDVNGYFTDGTAVGSVFFNLSPSRIVDTRNGTGAPMAKVGPAGTLVVHVAGFGGVPAMGSATPPSAVILNVTVTNSTAPSFLTLWPDGTSRPASSDLNFLAGQTVPNLVVVKIGATGDVDVYNSAGSTDVVVDVEGWFGS